LRYSKGDRRPALSRIDLLAKFIQSIACKTNVRNTNFVSIRGSVMAEFLPLPQAVAENLHDGDSVAF
jgi:hypothetical protein